MLKLLNCHLLRIPGVSFPILSLMIFLLLPGCDESNKKGPPSRGYSQSLSESKDKGVFEFQVAPYQSNLELDSGHKLEIKNAWVENQWSSQVYMIGATSIHKSENSHQLILIYNIIKNPQQNTPNVYYFVGSRPTDDSFVHYYCDRIDTIKVPLYRESAPIFPSKKNRKAFDSLSFVRNSEPRTYME
jgi:hypothetical protein